MLTIADVQALHARGELPKLLMFWGHTPARSDVIGAECLSQWYPSPFTVDGVNYPTAEHYMMAGKARLFGDDVVLAQILDARSPGEAKALGRRVRGFRRPTWDAECSEIVIAGNMAKFGQLAELGAFLAATRNRVLVEASPVDKIWGIGLAADDPRATDPLQWNGLNLLGFALMAARDRLAAA